MDEPARTRRDRLAMARLAPAITRTGIAYFTMEIGLQPEIHTYAGGLGMLAGDTARAAADLEVPIVFVSLISTQGYLRQEIDAQGRQVVHPDPWSPRDWVTPLRAKTAVVIDGREVWLRAWLYPLRGMLGFEVPVLLLDTDLEENDPQDRSITQRLYGGDEAYRLKQEAVLGIGGVRILGALGFAIHTYHMNEGHAALLAVELLKRHGSDAAAVRHMCIFTTHTPVEAGHDRFPYPLVETLLGDEVEIGQIKVLTGADGLNMTRLALELSGYVNGVAKRHAEVSGRMFQGHQVHAITNGVHAPTWTSPAMAQVFDQHLPGWRRETELLVRADCLPDDAVEAAHQEAKRQLLARIEALTGKALAPDVPLLGFARRMTGYKRPDLLFSDLGRLAAIQAGQPFQIVLAGKAHPRDGTGQEAIATIHRHIRTLDGRVPVVFLPDYGMALAQLLVAGCDVWLNTPLPPLEASGTSGMKAALNGVLNLSVLDGWWLEGCIEGVTGWAIGDGREGGTVHAEDAEALYRKLEDTVLPLYAGERGRWIGMMKEAISKLGSMFNSHRMLRRYATDAYLR